MTAFIIVVGVGVAIAILIYCVFILLGSTETKQKRAAQQTLLSETGGNSLVDLYNKAQTDEEREDIVLFALQSGSYKNTQQPASEAENITEEEKPLTESADEDYLEEDYLEENIEENIKENINEDFDEENNEIAREGVKEGFNEAIKEVVVYSDGYIEEEPEQFAEKEDIEQTIVGARKPLSSQTKEKELDIFDFSSPKNFRDKEE